MHFKSYVNGLLQLRMSRESFFPTAHERFVMHVKMYHMNFVVVDDNV